MLSDFKNAFQRYNNAHIQLILVNVVVFVAFVIMWVPMKLSGLEAYVEQIVQWLGVPSLFGNFVSKPWTIITYAFMHDLSGIGHIFWNMIWLYWFGRLFVEYLGSDKLIAVYVLGAIAGAITFLLAYNLIPYYHQEALEMTAHGGGYMVGASAAVDAIVIAAATLLPNHTFFLFLIGPIRIKYIALFVVFVSFLGTVGSNSGGNLAHLGGAAIGFIYIKQLQAGVNWGTWITITLEWFKNLFKERRRVKVTYRSNEPQKSSGKPAKGSNVSQEELDAILDKISAGGYESLTKDEKEKLFNASKK